MKKIIAAILMGVMMLIGTGAMTSEEVSAVGESICSDSSASSDMKELAGCNEDTLIDEAVNTGLNVVLSATGIIAVGVMVYGGFIYVTSQGDPGKVKKGRDIIIYGLVGLVVTLLAFAVVTFVSMSLPSPSLS